MKRLSNEGGSQNILVDHLFQYRISPWPKAAEKRGFCTGVTDGQTNSRTDRPTDGQRMDRRMDRPSDRDARTHLKTFKSERKERQPPFSLIRQPPLIRPTHSQRRNANALEQCVTCITGTNAG